MNSLLLLAALLMATIPPAHQPEPNARYLVLQVGESGRVDVLDHVLVYLPELPVSLKETQVRAAITQPSRMTDRWVVRQFNGRGENLFVNVLDVPRWRHVPLSMNQQDHPMVPVENKVLVARVPLAAGNVLNLSHLSTSTNLYLDAIPARVQVPALVPGAQPDNHVDVLVLGDGYSAAEESLFNSHVQWIRSRFLGISPYAEYASFFNFVALYTPSAQSGVDHPPYRADCSPYDSTCCGDPEMKIDPKAGTMVDTAFDGSYCLYNIHRLTGVDFNKVYQAAAAVPTWDQIIVVLNDSTWGGAGGGVFVTSINEYAHEIVGHEWGHTFSLLSDEYDDPYPGFPTCSDVTGFPCEANVTDVTDRSQLKWNEWVLASTPVPTPETASYDNVVGLFEGARYLTTGIYRPKLYCSMRALGVAFCEVCKEAFVLRLYEGGWGEPSGGVSLFDLGAESPVAGAVAAAHAQDTKFTVQTLVPPAWLQWSVDGQPVPGATGLSWTLSPGSPRPVEVRVTAVDGTALVTDSKRGTTQSTLAWNVTYANVAPVLLDIPDVTVNAGQTVQLTLHATDADLDALTFSAHPLPSGAVLDATSGMFTWQTPQGPAADHEITIEVTDGAALDTGVLRIHVQSASAPLFVPIEPRTVAEMDTLEFTVSATDPNNAPITLTASPLPRGAQFNQTNHRFSWTPDYEQAGPYTVTFTASNGTESSSLDVSITVTHTNRAPMLSPLEDHQVTVGEALSITVVATDPDGDPLTITPSTLPPGATFTAATGALSWTPTEQQVGPWEIGFSASDGSLSASQSLHITVVPAEQPDAGMSSSLEPSSSSMSATSAAISTGTSVIGSSSATSLVEPSSSSSSVALSSSHASASSGAGGSTSEGATSWASSSLAHVSSSSPAASSSAGQGTSSSGKSSSLAPVSSSTSALLASSSSAQVIASSAEGATSQVGGGSDDDDDDQAPGCLCGSSRTGSSDMSGVAWVVVAMLALCTWRRRGYAA